ncbi:MAG: DUF5668 domain-containing protein [Deltaproteobacteria bacterium]|nr:DUF5668 domain-containing protein [Deltaproteobacteria bacterium]
MQGNNNASESMSKRSHCYGMCGGSGSRIFCGIFFIVVGLFWLGKEANLFSSEVMTLFWPLVFILAGSWFIAAALINKENHH